MSDSEPRLTAYLVPHTHWDREWYQPLEVFRARLVDVVDTVLELLHDPGNRYRRFTLDGQAVAVEDYLTVRPERRGEVAELVRAGRLRIGPWYVLADEYLVSPEALVRNLQHGLRACRAFGGAMPVAYTPDSFGHVAQLPLLVDGFGLKAVIFERGVGDEGERLGTEFRWLASDGRTEVFAVHLVGTYSAATALGHLDWAYGDPYDADLAVRQVRAALFGPRASEAAFPTWLREAIERLPQGIAGYTRNGQALLLNGSDHLFPQRNLPEVIDALSQAMPTVRFQHADVEEYVDAPRPPLATLERYQGEFHASRYHHVLGGVWSARMPLKQTNHACETLLERYAEPLLAAAARVGHDDRPLLDHAWRRLLLNHAHDSICGCSIDPVHREMATRFETVRQVGDELCRRAVAALTADAAGPELAVFEPLPYDGWTVVHTEVEAAAGDGPRLTALDEAGRPLPSNRQVQRVAVAGRSDAWIDRVALSVALPTRSTSLSRMRLGAGDAHGPLPADPVRASTMGGGLQLENAALRIMVASDGTVVLLDRASGREHRLELRFEDVADAGDEYDFSPLAGDRAVVVRRPLAPPTLAAEGTLSGAIELRYRLELPQRLSDDRRERVGRVAMDVHVALGLEAFAERMDLMAELTNAAEDHRLRLRIDTGIDADHVWADGHWDVLRRPVRPPTADHWYQRPQPTGHQRRFVAVSDGGAGLAVLTRGLPEYEAANGTAGVELAVTLLRCVGWLSRDDLASRPQGAGPALPAPGAQCLGPHRFELAVVPFAGPWWKSRLPAAAERFTAPARVFAAGRAEPRPDLAPSKESTLGTRTHGASAAGLAGGAGGSDCPYPGLGIALTPPLTLSAAKLADAGSGLIVRLWNPSPEPVGGRLDTSHRLSEAFLTRLDESRGERLAIVDDGLELRLGPKEVVTVELTYHERGR